MFVEGVERGLAVGAAADALAPDDDRLAGPQLAGEPLGRQR